MSLAENRRLRLIVLCAFYVAQGIPWGFTAITIPTYLAGRGLDAGAIGAALAMTTLPYSFKWIWGIVIDSFTIPRFGRRRPWIVFAELMMAVTILAMILIPDLTRDLKMLAWMILIHTVFNSMQDVAVDALAVDLLSEDERGRANGFMYASKYGGGMIGGGGMTWVIVHAGFDAALIAQTVILLAIMLLPLFLRESNKPVEQRPRLGAVLRDLATVFSVRSAFATGALALVITMALGMLTTNGFVLFTHELHWSDEKYATLVGVIAPAAGAGGAAFGGILADKLGRKRLAAAASLAMAGGWLAFGLATPLWTNDWFVYPMAILEAATSAIMSVTLFAICMDVAWPRVGASQFAAYMAFANFSTTFGFKLAGVLNRYLEYYGVYLVAAGLQIAITGLVLAIDPKQVAREMPGLESGRVPMRGILAVGAFGVVLTAMTAYVIWPLISG